MGRFLDSEKIRQAQYKVGSPYFTDEARSEGVYRGKPRPFCLPVEIAEQNLIPEIRESALAHFAHYNIKWHDGKKKSGKPSNHLCSSQVCCVNLLFPFADKPDELAQVLRPVFPDIAKMLPVEGGRYVSFEWIGLEDYLCEKRLRKGQRTRGALFTSADSIVMFERHDRKRQTVLIEWKYAESYYTTSLEYSDSGTSRPDIYRHLFEAADCPINKDILPRYESLFYVPFYQLMRQQFLANEMEKAHEMDAHIVSVLHIAPEHNRDFLRVTSSELRDFGSSAINVWKRLVEETNRFDSISTEKLFGDLSGSQFSAINSWREYVYARYPWVCEQ